MTPPKVLVDTAVLDGSAGALPLTWLDGLDVLPYRPRALEESGPALQLADGLLLRTVTRLSAGGLARLSRLRAVATLSSGTDHLDEPALVSRGVTLATGHGGNARAVADWVEWALSRIWRRGQDLRGKRVLVVGAGAVGSQVAGRLMALGAEVLACDPPLQHKQPGFVSVDLDEALGQGPDAVTLHVPLTEQGPHPTRNLLDERRLARLPGSVVLNAARGGVLDEAAALRALDQGHVSALGLDTFVGEPRPDPRLVLASTCATPHIAGHSIEGKLDVAWRAVAGLRDALGLPPPPDLRVAIEMALQDHPTPADLDPDRALDATHLGLGDLARTGQPFDGLRHSHRRRERFAL